MEICESIHSSSRIEAEIDGYVTSVLYFCIVGSVLDLG